MTERPGDPRRFYDLLPRYIRHRDIGVGKPLLAMLEAFQRPYDDLEASLHQLYDDWFIETCAPEVVPKIAALLGIHSVPPSDLEGLSQRAFVGKALNRRRRKGIPSTLSRAVSDATGWPALTVQFADRLCRMQFLPALTSSRGGTLDLRTLPPKVDWSSPFLTLPCVTDISGSNGPGDAVPEPPSAQGRHAPEVLGVYAWRLQAFPVLRADAGRHPTDPSRFFTFDPFGDDLQVFNQPLDPPSDESGLSLVELPLPLDVEVLGRFLDDVQQGRPVASTGEERLAPVRIMVGGREIEPGRIEVRPLETWHAPSAGNEVAVDPVRGRIAFAGAPDGRVRVSYSYGFSSAIGGGPYHREHPAGAGWRRDVVQHTSKTEERSTSLHQALFDYVREAPPRARINVLDSATYAWMGDDPSPELERGAHLQMPAGGWLAIDAGDGEMPAVLGNLTVRGQSASNNGTFEPPILILSGFMLRGTLEIEGAVTLRIEDCTLSQDDPTVPVMRSRDGVFDVDIRRSILGRVELRGQSVSVTVSDSVLDAGSDHWSKDAVQIDDQGSESGAVVDLRRVTVFGGVTCESLVAVDTLVTGAVHLSGRSDSLIRHSIVPPPDAGQRMLSKASMPGSWEQALTPNDFTSVRRDRAGYAQLSWSAPTDALRGGTDGAEIGVFHSLFVPQRLSLLPRIFDEYVRWGMRGRLFFMS